MFSLSSLLGGGVLIDTFFPFAMRQVGIGLLSSSVRFVKRHEPGEALWIAILATPHHRCLSSRLPNPILHPHEHDLGTSSSCIPCSCHISCTCLFSILSSHHSSFWGNRLCNVQLLHTHSIASSCFFSCTCHQNSSCNCCHP